LTRVDCGLVCSGLLAGECVVLVHQTIKCCVDERSLNVSAVMLVIRWQFVDAVHKVILAVSPLRLSATAYAEFW